MIATADATAFLRAVVGEPDDDLPRLVFADWLDEHGDPQRAEFIRVQCELAKCEATADGDPVAYCIGDKCYKAGPTEVDSLRRRERELWHDDAPYYGLFLHCRHALDSAVPNLAGSWAAFLDWPNLSEYRPPALLVRRGFPSQLTLSWDDWQTHADALLAACPLRGRDGLVKLTTWPTEPTYPDNPRLGLVEYLETRWGVRSELPPQD